LLFPLSLSSFRNLFFVLLNNDLELLHDGLGELPGRSLATKITSECLTLSEGGESGLLNAIGVLVEAHVSQHHHRAEEKSSGVGKTLASDIRGGTVNGLEDGALITDVAGGGKTKTTNETGAHVGENITVEVGHDEDLVVVGNGVGGHLEAGVVEKLSIKLNVRELLGDLLGGLKEETVGHLHDGGLVDDADLLAANGAGMLEGESEDALRGVAGDKLDALNDTIDNNVLNARILALGVLTDQDGVDVIVGGLVSGNRAAGTEVGEEVEGTAQSQVEGDVALADGSLFSL
jgi:hypothetical protein